MQRFLLHVAFGLACGFTGAGASKSLWSSAPAASLLAAAAAHIREALLEASAALHSNIVAHIRESLLVAVTAAAAHVGEAWSIAADNCNAKQKHSEAWATNGYGRRRLGSTVRPLIQKPLRPGQGP